jgi:hypothetical protein
MRGLVLSLCDFSGVWSQPYADAGYYVTRVDIQYQPGETKVADNILHIGCDVGRFDIAFMPDVVLAAPPCTCFCRPGARWWKRQDESGQTAGDVSLFINCLRLCRRARLYWALENPPGRHFKLMPELLPPAWQFQPWEYGDPWHKQTYIWGTAAKPFATRIVKPPPTRRTPNGRTQGVIARMSGTWANERARTPPGFARAFFEANEPPNPPQP